VKFPERHSPVVVDEGVISFDIVAVETSGLFRYNPVVDNGGGIVLISAATNFVGIGFILPNKNNPAFLVDK
jgi:hypothetical protein